MWRVSGDSAPPAEMSGSEVGCVRSVAAFVQGETRSAGNDARGAGNSFTPQEEQFVVVCLAAIFSDEKSYGFSHMFLTPFTPAKCGIYFVTLLSERIC